MNNIPLSPKKVFISLSILATLFLVGSYTIFTQSASGQSCVESPSGLVSWWNGDIVSGQTVSGINVVPGKIVSDLKDGNNGTLKTSRGATYIIKSVSGKVGNAFKNSGDGYITMGNSANLNFGNGPFSLETWFKWDGGEAAPGVSDIIRKSNHPAQWGGYWLRVLKDEFHDKEHKLDFFVGYDRVKGSSLKTAIALISPGVWYHAVATMDHDIMKLYLNGELKNTSEVDGLPAAINANTTTDAPFLIGGSNYGGYFQGKHYDGFTQAFWGLIDEVSIYNRALSQSEVSAIFNAGSAGKCLPSTTPEPPKSPTPAPSKPPVSVSLTPTKSPIPKVLSAITYPVADLGNCTSYEDCKTYCGVSTNYAKCITYAQKIGLEIEIPDDKKAIFVAMQKGESPGQCKDEISCRAYCGDVDRIGECVDFVEKFKLASSDELKEMRKMADIKKAGVAFPGNCKTKESCLKYCDDSANAVVCMEFAQKAGFIPKEDAEAVSKILPYLKSGGKLPGGCTTKKSCDTYCANDANTIECVDFAAGAGFMTKEDADIVKRTGGKGPGNCKSREACDSYCRDAAHIDECVDFAVKAGFISKEDAEMAKRYKITSGPGGCKSKADCEAFCIVNRDVCFQFAKDHGMLSEEDLKNIKQREEFMKSLDKAPPKWLACMEKELGTEFFGRFKTGKLTQPEAKSSTLETAQRKCEKEMSSDTTECLTKPTCKEFFSCLNPDENKALQRGEEESSNPELKKRVDFCKEESVEIKQKEVQEKMDACLSRSCSEFDACIKSAQSSGQGGEQQGGQQQGEAAPNPKLDAKVQACQQEKINACLAKSCGEFQACINALGGGGGGGGGGTPDPAVQAKFKSCQPPKQTGPSSGGGGGDQSGIPQGYSSWEAFCRTNSGDSRCAAYAPQIPQQYPLLLRYPTFATILNFLLGARR